MDEVHGLFASLHKVDYAGCSVADFLDDLIAAFVQLDYLPWLHTHHVRNSDKTILA